MGKHRPHLESKNLVLRMLEKHEAPLALEYFDRNKEHLSIDQHEFGDRLLMIDYWEQRLLKNLREFEEGSSVRLFILPRDQSVLIGTCNFTDFIRGAYQGCSLGYGIDQKFQSRGYMTEALATAIKFVFESENIHKINAYYMPKNVASGRVLSKLSFKVIGLAPQELYLFGKWEDHIEARLINSEWKNTLEF